MYAGKFVVAWQMPKKFLYNPQQPYTWAFYLHSPFSCNREEERN